MTRLSQLGAGLFLVFTFPSVFAGAAMDTPTNLNKEVEALVKAEWRKLSATVKPADSPDKFVSWEYAISPPFPSVWPPEGKGAIYYYAYAYGLNSMRLADGQFVAAPWARIKVNAGGKPTPRLETLSRDIKEIGIQGVRPLMPDEVAIYTGGATVENDLFQLFTAAKRVRAGRIEAPMLRTYYCQWLKDNGTIAEQIRPLHKSFFDWLGCE